MQALVAPDCGFFTAIAQHGRYFQRIFDILPLEQIYVCETDPSLVPSGVVLVGFTMEGIRAVLGVMTAVLQEMQTHGVPISQHHPFCMYHDIVCALSGYIAPELQDMRGHGTDALFKRFHEASRTSEEITCMLQYLNGLEFWHKRLHMEQRRLVPDDYEHPPEARNWNTILSNKGPSIGETKLGIAQEIIDDTQTMANGWRIVRNTGEIMMEELWRRHRETRGELAWLTAYQTASRKKPT